MPKEVVSIITFVWNRKVLQRAKRLSLKGLLHHCPNPSEEILISYQLTMLLKEQLQHSRLHESHNQALEQLMIALINAQNSHESPP